MHSILLIVCGITWADMRFCRQNRCVLGRRRQCRNTSLPGASGKIVEMLLASPLYARMCLALVRGLLQPVATL